MNIAQRLQELIDSSGISRSRLAREIGVHTSTVSNWLDGKEVKAENLSTLCSYFGCTLDYLAGQIPEKEIAPVLTKKDERDIGRDLERIMEDLEGSGDLMFDGVPMSQEAIESLKSAMKLGLEAVKLRNKETYTPKKYRRPKKEE